MYVYNKIIRDKVLENIIQDNETPVYVELSDEEALPYFEAKLMEEVKEYLHEGKNNEELVDIYNVLLKIIEIKGLTDKFNDLNLSKIEKNGGFNKNVFLIGTFDPRRYHINTDFNEEQIKEITKGIKYGIDVSKYADANKSASEMHDIRKKLMNIQYGKKAKNVIVDEFNCSSR